MNLAARVAARFIADTQLMVHDEQRFVLDYLPKHAIAVDAIVTKVNQAMDMYQAAGIRLQHKVLVRLHGKGAAHADALYWFHSNPPLIVIAPKAYRDPILVKTLVHEFGHYLHDKVVPGGIQNQEVVRRFFWAMRQKATGAGPRLDVVRKRIKVLEAELDRLADAKYILKPLPKKGQVFEFDKWVQGQKLRFKGKIIKKSGPDVVIEVMNPEVIPFSASGYYPKKNGVLLITESIKSLLFDGYDPKVEAEIVKLEGERTKLYEEAKEIARSEKDDRYETQRSDWAPTQYSRKNTEEWFAELCTTYVLGHLKKPVAEWLLSVTKTGQAPSEMALPD
jgi:hypothetical protein